MSSNPKILEHRLNQTSKPGPLYGCIHIPDSTVQAIVRNEPELRRRPVAVLDGTFPLFTVMATNMLARRLGVHLGMNRLQLERFSGLTIRYRSRDSEDSAHRALIDCAHVFTPRVEDTASDTVTLDLNGLSRLWGTPRAMAQKLFRAADTLGLEAHVAIASNPDAAVHAAKAESGITIIPVGHETQKLASLDLKILASSEEIKAVFERWGLQTFQDLARLPQVHVAERLGQEGVQLHKMAQGKTTRTLRVLNEKPYFKESLELEGPIESLEPLIFIFSRLLKQLCQRLAARNRATNELRLTLTLEPPFDGEAPSFIRTLRLPTPTRDSRILLKLLQLDLDGHRPPAAVIAITLTAEPVRPRHIQNGLFTPLAPEPEKLELTLARIGNIVGTQNVGSPELLNTHRPDAYRIHHFIPPKGGRKRSPAPRSHSMALRAFRPPLEARVEMLGRQPSRIFFAGKSGRVTTARGPWNSSGEWWRAHPWKREEWDVEIQTGSSRALYRIYRDPYTQQWFVDAMYD